MHTIYGKKCWNNSLWITTLSCNKGSIRLRPECPWRSRKSTIIPKTSVQYWYLLFCSSSLSPACFPTIIRPILRLWKMILKMVLCSPELNCSVFSLYCLRVSKNMDFTFFEISYAMREKKFLVQYQSTFFHSSEWCSVKNQQVLSFVVFCFCLRSGCKILYLQLWRSFFRQIFRTFCVVVVWINHKFIWSMRNSDPGLTVVFTSETKFWFQLRVYHTGNWS